MVLKTDIYTDGSNNAAGSVIKGTVVFDAQGMDGKSPFAVNSSVNYSGIMYDIGVSTDFDISMDFTINSNSFAPVTIWLCSSTSDTAIGNVYGMNFTDTLSNVYVANPSFAWIEQAVGPWRIGNSTVRIVGKYTSGPTLTLSVYDGATLKKTVPITGAQVFSGRWFGPANSIPLGNRARSFSYEDGTVAPVGGPVQTTNDELYYAKKPSGPDATHKSLADLIKASAGVPGTKLSINDILSGKYPAVLANRALSINDRLYYKMKPTGPNASPRESLNDLLAKSNGTP